MSIEANRSIVFQAIDITCVIEEISVLVKLNENQNHWHNMPAGTLANKLETLKDELTPIFDKYFGEGVWGHESFEHEIYLKSMVNDELEKVTENALSSMVTECPHCSSIWSPGSEEFDIQQCFSCGKLADEPIED